MVVSVPVVVASVLSSADSSADSLEASARAPVTIINQTNIQINVSVFERRSI